MTIRVSLWTACLLSCVMGVPKYAAGDDGYSWFAVDNKVGLAHPSEPLNYVAFWMDCHDAEQPWLVGDIYMAYVDLDWESPLSGELDLTIQLGEATFNLVAEGIVDDMDGGYLLRAEIVQPGDFLQQLGASDAIAISASGTQFAADVENAAEAASAMLAACPG